MEQENLDFEQNKKVAEAVGCPFSEATHALFLKNCEEKGLIPPGTNTNIVALFGGLATGPDSIAKADVTYRAGLRSAFLDYDGPSCKAVTAFKDAVYKDTRLCINSFEGVSFTAENGQVEAKFSCTMRPVKTEAPGALIDASAFFELQT